MSLVLDFNSAKPLGDHDVARRTRATVDVEDIKGRLNADPRAFVEWLFSGRAFCTTREARIGDVSGSPGGSLSIALAGRDPGLWHDHATGEGGDLIALYMAHMGYDGRQNFALALKEIASEFLGDPVPVERPAWQPTATQRIAEKRQKLGTKPRAEYQELGAPVATWKYKDTAGNVVASVERYEPESGKTYRPWCFKVVNGERRWMKGAPDLRPLYNLAGIANASHVVLVEGEKAAQALIDVGIDATTAMQGAEAPIDKTDWSPLHGKAITFWPDNDEPGFKYGRAVMARLAALGCEVRFVTPPTDAPAKWDAADCVADGGDANGIVAAAAPYAGPVAKPRIRLLSLREMESLPPIAWLIQDIVTECGLSMIWGRSGSLKSFVALDMAMAIASGQAWHGRPVRKGRVIYVAAEGAFGLARRAIGWRENRGQGAEPDILLVPHGVTLTSDDLAALIDAIQEAGEPPVLIVIDTMSRTFGGGNPNQPADMNLYVAAADRLREATSAHTMIVHHAGEDEDRNEVGNKGLRNACDTVIFVKRTRDQVQLVNEAPKGKQKDAEEFKTIHMRPAKVAYQQGGEERTTLVLNLEEPASKGSGEPSAAPSQKLGSVERKIVTALEKAKTPLGLTRLATMTATAKGTLHASLATLVEKAKIEKIRSDDDSRDEWCLT